MYPGELIINLETGETRYVDVWTLREFGMPEGFRSVDGIQRQEWVGALQKALGKKDG
jgi:hypothetical protein